MKILRSLLVITVFSVSSLVAGQVCTKPMVGDRIRKVEDGTDQFRKYVEHRGDEGKDRAENTQNSARTRRGGRTASESQKETARDKKDDLEDALDDLNRSTNRLRRKFDPTDKWLETRPQVERVLDDGRRINQALARGKYGSQAERYWSVLRASMNDLAHCYNLTPLGR